MAQDDSDSDDSQPSLFDDPGTMAQAYLSQDHYTSAPHATPGSDEQNDPLHSYDLKPPPPALALSNIELLHDRLFSVDHLKLILRNASYISRFSNFLSRYRPQSAPSLQRYIDTQKAISAVKYANALAGELAPGASAAQVDKTFENQARQAVEDLVSDALPAYVTHRMVQVSTEALVKEITGQNTPIMRELVRGLAEVYCLTDPSLPDNPIVYASEEFYRCTQYGRDYVIGRNCRFLQGPRTPGAAVNRLLEALSDGQEICETILNYRRDGSPFMNLLMIAPLFDNKGTVRYFIGAQIDINGLIEGGRGLDSFEGLLTQDRSDQRYQSRGPQTRDEALADLSSLWDTEELATVKKSNVEKPSSQSGKSGSSRMFFGMDDPSDKNLWPAPSLGPSGRLPGVFQNASFLLL